MLRRNGRRQATASMSPKEAEDFESNHLMFGEPASEQLVAGGFHHDWPDARGLFVNAPRDVLAWVNQEDHIRIFAMQMGGEVKAAFTRMCAVVRELETGESQRRVVESPWSQFTSEPQRF
jgi:hypothetical protein